MTSTSLSTHLLPAEKLQLLPVITKAAATANDADAPAETSTFRVLDAAFCGRKRTHVVGSVDFAFSVYRSAPVAPSNTCALPAKATVAAPTAAAGESVSSKMQHLAAAAAPLLGSAPSLCCRRTQPQSCLCRR